MTYKSSPLLVFVNFIRSAVLIFLSAFMLFGLLMMMLSFLGIDGGGISREASKKLLCVVAVAAVVVAAFLAFYRNNIKIKVTDDAVLFFRGNREYQCFPFASFAFASYVHKYRYSLFVSTSRYLRVVQIPDAKTEDNQIHRKDYKCYNFNRKTFEDFISHVRLPLAKFHHESIEGADPESESGAQQTPAPAVTGERRPEAGGHRPGGRRSEERRPGEPLVFHIDKQLLIKHYKKPFLALFIPFCALILLLLAIQFAAAPDMFFEQIAMNAAFFGTFSIIILPIPVFMFGIPLSGVKKNTPNKITLFNDRMTLDDKTFYFSRIKQIKVTPPSYRKRYGMLRRKMTIIEDGKVRKFIIGDERDVTPITIKKGKPKVFEDYYVFCSELESLLANEPNKFMLELG